MLEGIKDFFGGHKTPDSATQQGKGGGVAKRPDDTYAQWGSKYAGHVAGDNNSLQPALDLVLLTEKQRQTQDEHLQAALKAKYQEDIETNKNNIQAEEQTKARYLDNKKKCKDKIEELNTEIEKIKEGKGNKHLAKVKFYLFALITLGLGIYLYLFYGSAAYSAFFGDSESIQSVSEAIFNSLAFKLAWAHGALNFFLILLFPTIFVALGVMLHNFSQEGGYFKYLKILALLFVAFIFDSLLAYKISEMFYIPTMEAPKYTLSMAFESGDFWFVIFCGFVSYIIWGLVFGQMMACYEEMSEGRITINRLNKQIEVLNKKIAEIDSKIQESEETIKSLNNDIAHLNKSLNQMSIISYTVVEQCLNEFITGWYGYLNLVGKEGPEKEEATNIFNNFMASIHSA